MRVRGGLIGSNPSASQTVASNIWHIRDAESYSRSGNWAALPGAPTGLTGTNGNTQVSLTWTAPAATGGYAITDYTVQYSSNSGISWTTFSRSASTATSVAVTGLTNGTAYLFRVAAVTVMGTGGYSATFSGSPAGSLLSLAYTEGSWNGIGSSASPYTSSSTFGPMNSTELPFSFTATADCDVLFSFNHYNEEWNDNHSAQTVYIRIYNTARTSYTTLPYRASQYNGDGTSATFALTTRLFSGETLKFYVQGDAPYSQPIDRYRNVSVSASTPSASKIALLQTGSLGSFSGVGTSSSKLIAPTPIAAANTYINANPIQYNAFNSTMPVLVTLENCTVYFSATVQSLPDDNNQNLVVQGYSTTGQFLNGVGSAYIAEGTTGTSSLTLPRGTPFWFLQNSGGTQVSNLQVWAT